MDERRANVVLRQICALASVLFAAGCHASSTGHDAGVLACIPLAQHCMQVHCRTWDAVQSCSGAALSATPCGGFDVADWQMDGGGREEEFFDHDSGALAAELVWFANSDAGAVCVAGPWPDDFAVPDCTGVRFSTAPCGNPQGQGGPYLGEIGFSKAGPGATPPFAVGASFQAADSGPVPDAGPKSDAGEPVCLGDCCFQALGSQPIPVITASPDVSAGTLTVTANGTEIAQLDPRATLGDYVTPYNSPPSWQPGDTLMVSANGDFIGAFSATLMAPPDLVVTPDLSQTGTLSLSGDVTVTWTAYAPPAGQTSTVTIAVHDNDVGSISCTVDDSAGQATIQKALLANFGSGDRGSIDFERDVSTTAMAPNAQVAVGHNYGFGFELSYVP